MFDRDLFRPRVGGRFPLRRPAVGDLPFAAVLALDSMQGLQTARILAGHGVPVVGFLDDRRHHAARTRACRQVVASQSQDEMLDQLAGLGRILDEKAVLVPCSDARVLMAARYRSQLEEWYHIPLPPTEVVELLMMKDRFYRFAIENDFPLQPTWMMADGHEIADVADQITYPAALKPTYRTKTWTANTNEKAFKLESRQALIETYEKARRWSDDLIVQEWIEGGVDSLYSCNCYIDSAGEVLASFVARKLRQWPPETGQSSLGEEVRNDTVLKETLRVLAAVDYRGLAYMEMKRDSRTGNHYIVEPNIGRPTGRSAIAEAGGVDLLFTMYCDATGLPLPDNRQQTFTGVKWIHLRRDLQSAVTLARRGELSFGEWFRSVRGPKAFAIWSSTDPLPFFFDLYEAAVRSRRKADST